MTPRSLKTLLLVVVLLFVCACDKPSNQTNSKTTATPQSTPAASPLTAFERDLQFIRNGQYTYVFVFSRKDGKPLDKDDGAFLRSTAPQVVDWVITDNGKKAIGGTNFNLEEGGMAQLRKRFVVEDYSGR